LWSLSCVGRLLRLKCLYAFSFCQRRRLSFLDVLCANQPQPSSLYTESTVVVFTMRSKIAKGAAEVVAVRACAWSLPCLGGYRFAAMPGISSSSPQSHICLCKAFKRQRDRIHSDASCPLFARVGVSSIPTRRTVHFDARTARNLVEVWRTSTFVKRG
jgi:hypothetical protein